MRRKIEDRNTPTEEILTETQFWQCFAETIKVHPERIKIFAYIVTNYRKMTAEEIFEKAYQYAAYIKEEDLFARQIFLCLIRLAERVGVKSNENS